MTSRDRTYDESPCWDCTEGRHEDCRRNGGFPHPDSGWDERCVCHVLLDHVTWPTWVDGQAALDDGRLGV